MEIFSFSRSTTKLRHCFFHLYNSWEMKMAIWKQQPGSSSSDCGTLLLLFNVLNHIVIWQVRWLSNALIKSVSPAVTECIFPRIDELVSRPGKCKDTEWVALWYLQRQGRSGEQTARQRGQTSGCYWEARVILEGCVVEEDSPHCWSHFVLSRSSVQNSLMRLQSPWITKQLPLTASACQ